MNKLTAEIGKEKIMLHGHLFISYVKDNSKCVSRNKSYLM